MDTLGRWFRRLMSIADDESDDDDLRLRKRVGVAAGLLTVIAPASLPIQALGHPLSYVFAAALSVFSIGNLAILARTHAFDRYLLALITAGTLWVPLAQVVGGGITGSSPGLVWAFLVPAYAILALGPWRAVPWFLAFVASVIFMALVDPWARQTFGEPPYVFRVIGWSMNVVLPLSIVFVLLRYADVRRRAAEARVDELLFNAIPASIATRLKRGEGRIADSYAETSVLFADVAGFTPWTSRTDADRVVGLLDDLFTRFDLVVAEFGIEKLKTMGDAYMAVAGAPVPREDHAARTIDAARAMLRAAADWRDAHGVALELRIGIASGPSIGGVIGQQRLLFDLWGDMVNTASRMQTTGIPGRIQVSEATMRRTVGRYEFEERTVDVKGLGPLRAFLVRDTE